MPEVWAFVAGFLLLDGVPLASDTLEPMLYLWLIGASSVSFSLRDIIRVYLPASGGEELVMTPNGLG